MLIENIELNKKQRKLLRYIKRHDGVIDKSQVNDNSIELLLKEKLIKQEIVKKNNVLKRECGKLWILNDGINWLEFYGEKNKRFWIPLIISLIALFRPEITVGTKRLMQILIHT